MEVGDRRVIHSSSKQVRSYYIYWITCNLSRTIFNLFDLNGDQSITFEELGVVLRSMGHNPSEKELIEMIGEMDEDDSGTVDFEVIQHINQSTVKQNLEISEKTFPK